MLGGAGSAGGEVFSGVRFVLFGFDSVSEAQYRSEVVRRGGVDVGRYDSSCTHVIVSGHVYDDPVCAVARNDGKILVTELWIEDSVDFAILADANRILYRPVRDLNGIPGSESLFICLTGYQRRERDDIMKMVDLMGAHFSKPLIATKVTHLICYKFEGDKYELAKRVDIKLVNHRWLEDCLKSWEILPVHDYKKSGWELEIMEAEAWNSNEEAEGNSREQQLTKRSMTAENSRQNSGLSSCMVILSSPKTSIPTVEALTIPEQDPMPQSELPSTKFEDNPVDNASASKESNKARVSTIFRNCNITGKIEIQDGKGGKDTVKKEISLCNSLVTSSSLINSNKEGNKLILDTINGGSMSSDSMEVKSSSLIYLRKTPTRSVSAEDLSRKVGVFPRSSLANGIPSLTVKQDTNDIEFVGIEGQITNTDLHHIERLCNELPQKMKVPNFSSMSPMRQPGNSDTSAQQNSLANSSTQLKIPLVNGACRGGSGHQLNDVKNLSDTIVPSCPKAKEGKKLSPGTVNGMSMSSDATEVKSTSLIYSRKIPRRSASKELSRKIGVFSRSSPAEGIACSILQQDINDIESTGIQSPTTNMDLHHMEGLCSELPQKRKIPSFSSTPSNSPCGNSDTSALQNTLPNSGSAQLELLLPNGVCQGDLDSQLHVVKNLSDVIIPACLPANQKRNSLISSSAAFRKSVKHESNSKANDIACLKGQLVHSFHNDGSKLLALDQRSTFDELPDLGTRVGAPSPIGCEFTNFYHDCKPVEVIGTGMSIRNAADNLGTRFIAAEHEDAISPECKIPGAPLLSTCEFSFQPDKGDIPMIEQSNIQTGETGQARNLMCGCSSSCSGKYSEMGWLSNFTDSSCKASSRKLTKKVVARKKLSCRSELNAEEYSNEVVSPNESTFKTEQEKGTGNEQTDNDENSDTVGIVTKDVIVQELAKGQNLAFKTDRIVINKDRVVPMGEKNVATEFAFNSKEIKEPIPKETAVDKDNGMTKSVPNNLVARRKGKKSRHRVNNNNRYTKNETELAMQVLNDPEKENKRAGNDGIIRKADILEDHSMTVKCGQSGWNSRGINDTTSTGLQNHLHNEVISQPGWFIFSGPRLQRKEFQKVVRSLKGRFCRDSHSWSYEATFFIAPNPLRRTEIFFAAAASGRWILKADYLTACNEVGKFLDEEPFEWYGNGLTEDGTISLQAPRKWRLLRERTGCGAFYGMRIIIYGECIAPSLDTLKRVMKAGGGMILATSPPYTRFLKSRVDFAIIGPSMPRADTWIQEFLRHEVACVLPDYLVDFVCKPGYPLDKHILHKTHACVEKSVAKLLSQSKEIVAAEHYDAV